MRYKQKVRCIIFYFPITLPGRLKLSFPVLFCPLESVYLLCLYLCRHRTSGPSDFTQLHIQWERRGRDSRSRTVASGRYFWRHSSRMTTGRGLLGKIAWTGRNPVLNWENGQVFRYAPHLSGLLTFCKVEHTKIVESHVLMFALLLAICIRRI